MNNQFKYSGLNQTKLKEIKKGGDKVKNHVWCLPRVQPTNTNLYLVSGYCTFVCKC